jgi:hypothetical protein
MSSDTSAMQGNLAPRIEIERTDFGFHYGAIRALDSDGNFQVRITAYIAPFLCLIPPGGMAFMAVPRDDNATRFYNIWWSSTERLDSGPGYDKRIELWGLNPDILESTGMRAQNPSPESDIKANRFIQNRTAMEQGESFSGLPGITAEDAALSVAMGPIAPRTHEHLVESDAAVVQLRRWLLEAARAETMPAHEGTGTPAGQISAASGDLKPSQDWRELVRQHQVIDRETQRA